MRQRDYNTEFPLFQTPRVWRFCVGVGWGARRAASDPNGVSDRAHVDSGVINYLLVGGFGGDVLGGSTHVCVCAALFPGNATILLLFFCARKLHSSNNVTSMQMCFHHPNRTDARYRHSTLRLFLAHMARITIYNHQSDKSAGQIY